MNYTSRLRGFLAILLITTPLIVTNQTHDKYELPKMTFIYLGAIVLAVWFLLQQIWQANNPKIKLPHWTVMGYLITIIIATLLSSHAYTSFWGYYGRFNGGLASFLAFFVLYFVVINSKIKIDEKIMLYSFLGAVLVAIFGLYQMFVTPPGTRITASFGQPNWLASYLSLNLVLGMMLISKFDVSVFLRYLFAAASLLIYTVLWFTYSLSGVLATVVSVVIFFGIYKNNVQDKKVVYAILVFFVTLISAANSSRYISRVEDVKLDLNKFEQAKQINNQHLTSTTKTPQQTDEQQDLKQVTTVNNISDPTYIRVNLWKGSIKLSLSTPKVFLFGTGPETFAYEFQRFRPAELNYSSEWDFIMNKPHNYYLEILTESGVVSLLFYLLITFYCLFSKTTRKMVPFFASHFVAVFFGWPTVTTSLMFWLFLTKLDTS